MPRKSAPPPAELSHFGARLRYARDMSGLGVRRLASASTVSASSITRAELHGCVPDAGAIIRLAAALGVRAGWLLTGEEPIKIQKSTCAT